MFPDISDVVGELRNGESRGDGGTGKGRTCDGVDFSRKHEVDRKRVKSEGSYDTHKLSKTKRDTENTQERDRLF